MKLQKTFLLIILLLAAFQVCFGQETPKAILVDEFSAIGCEDFLSRINNFYIQLQNDPNSQGYAVISGDNSYLRRKLAYELWLNGAVKFLKRDGNRIIKVRSKETSEIKIQLWIVPASAEKPDFDEAIWDFKFPPKTKPFIFHDSFEQICSSVFFENVFVEYLEANPSSRGHIVIYDKSPETYRKEKEKIQKLLFQIPQNQLKFFYIKKDHSNIEFWLVPRKKK